MLQCARGLLRYNGCFSVSPTSTISRDGRGGGRDLENGVVSHRVDCCVYFIEGASIRRKKSGLFRWVFVVVVVCFHDRGEREHTKKRELYRVVVVFLLLFLKIDL